MDHIELPFEDAAARLGITTAALRKRIRRGKSLTGYQRDGRWYVLLPEDASEPAAEVNEDTAGDAAKDTSSDSKDAAVDASFLREIIERQDRQIAFLQERVQRQEHIVAALLQRIPELSAGASESPESDENRRDGRRAKATSIAFLSRTEGPGGGSGSHTGCCLRTFAGV